MTKHQSSVGKALWTVAAVAAVTLFSFNVLGNPWSAAPSTDSSASRDDKAETKEENETKTSCEEDIDDSGQARDTREDETKPTASSESSAESEETAEVRTAETEISTPERDASTFTNSSPRPEALTPPSTPLKTTTKGKKWRDRLSAKKQLKFKQHQKLRDQALPEQQNNSFQSE